MEECWLGFHTLDVEMAIDDLKEICRQRTGNCFLDRDPSVFAVVRKGCQGEADVGNIGLDYIMELDIRNG